MIVHSVRDNMVIVHSKPVTNNRKTLKIDNFSKNYIIKQSFIHICILPDMTEKCVMVHTDLNLASHMIRLLKQLRKQNKKILAIFPKKR